MARDRAFGRILAGTVTTVGLGMVWLAVVIGLPLEQEFSANDSHSSQRAGLVRAVKTPLEPIADLSITSTRASRDALSAPSSDRLQSGWPSDVSSVSASSDRRSAQVTRMRCEAEIEQICPDSVDNAERMKCFEQNKGQLATPCQQQIHERFVKWKEDQGRMLAACREDVKRWCAFVKAGEGGILQCLQDHAQQVSDRCYENLPKGTVSFVR